MKDEALTPVAFKMEHLPIAVMKGRNLARATDIVSKLCGLTGQEAAAGVAINDWLSYLWDRNYSPHMTRTAHAPAGPAAGVARASRMAVRALRPLRRPVSTMEQRAA